jgi:hypothetical protein
LALYNERLANRIIFIITSPKVYIDPRIVTLSINMKDTSSIPNVLTMQRSSEVGTCRHEGHLRDLKSNLKTQ